MDNLKICAIAVDTRVTDQALIQIKAGVPTETKHNNQTGVPTETKHNNQTGVHTELNIIIRQEYTLN